MASLQNSKLEDELKVMRRNEKQRQNHSVELKSDFRRFTDQNFSLKKSIVGRSNEREMMDRT